MSILAGIVTFNPNLDRLKKNINHICKQVTETIIFDNGSSNQGEIKKLCEEYGNLTLILSDTNRGLAHGLNRVCIEAAGKEAKWILLLDQDSISDTECIAKYSKYLSLEKAAILCPVMFDSRRRTKEFFTSDGYEIVNECIQSGALYNVEVLKKLNYFDEWYFIDYIDYDYCLMVRRNGYKIYQINNLLLDQEASTIAPVFCHDFLFGLSKKTNIQFFAKMSYRPVVKPWRSYYTARNRVYYIHKNQDMINVPIEMIKGFFANTRNTIRIPDHIGTLKAITKGTLDGYKKIREMKS